MDIVLSRGSFHLKMEEPAEGGEERLQESEGIEDTSRTWPLIQLSGTHICPQRLKQQAWDLHRSISGLSVYNMLWLLACCFCRTPNSGSGNISYLLLRLFFSFCVSLPSFNLKAFACFVISCFVLLGYCLLEACSLLKRKQ